MQRNQGASKIRGHQSAREEMTNMQSLKEWANTTGIPRSEKNDDENTSNSKKLDAILDQYLKIIKPLSVDTYTDPILFWKINGSRFKELEPLAKIVLGVQASEAAVERMFS